MKIETALVLAAISAAANAQTLLVSDTYDCRLTANSASDSDDRPNPVQTCVNPVFNLQYDDYQQQFVFTPDPNDYFYDGGYVD